MSWATGPRARTGKAGGGGLYLPGSSSAPTALLSAATLLPLHELMTAPGPATREPASRPRTTRFDLHSQRFVSA